MYRLTVFNNKGGVGKTTLTFHLAHILSDMGKKVLLIDLDPQCNLSMTCLPEEQLLKIWEEEEEVIYNWGKDTPVLRQSPRTIHYLLKPTEIGESEFENLPIPCKIEHATGLYLIPGRPTLHMFEAVLGRRYSEINTADPLALRTVSNINRIAKNYALKHGFDFVLFDTSPSLGTLNKVVLSFVDAFMIPCQPDSYSSYGIKHIGKVLDLWIKEFDKLKGALNEQTWKTHFEDRYINLLGYVVYNAKKYEKQTNNEYNLAQAHNNYIQKFPQIIKDNYRSELHDKIPQDTMALPIGRSAITHTHNTFTAIAQKYHAPMWKIPALNKEWDKEDTNTLNGAKPQYLATKEKYESFANDVLERLMHMSRF